MSCPHFSVSAVKRSKNQSAVASAAYQSRERLFSEHDQKMKDYRRRKGDIIAEGIILSSHAPEAYGDRQTLWNSVEKNEKRRDSRLAQVIVMALPEEIPEAQYEELIRTYCKEQFVSVGMIADYAIHDNGKGNPHAHIMLTLRAIDENGQWKPKVRRVYDLDENGDRIRLPSGKYRHHDEYTAEWSSREIVAKWRSAWAEAVNRCFEKNGIGKTFELSSYAKQGKEELPTVHMGAAATALEAKGISTEIGDYNRQIKANNAETKKLIETLKTLDAEIAEIDRELDSLPEERPGELSVTDIINEYLDLEKEKHEIWKQIGLKRAAEKELKKFCRIRDRIQEIGIRTPDDFHALAERYQSLDDMIAGSVKRIRKLNEGLRCIDTVARLQEVADRSRTGLRIFREDYEKRHQKELRQYEKAFRYLKENHFRPEDRKRMLAEVKTLSDQTERYRSELGLMNIDRDMIGQIRQCIETVIHRNETAQGKRNVPETDRNVKASVLKSDDHEL